MIDKEQNIFDQLNEDVLRATNLIQETMRNDNIDELTAELAMLAGTACLVATRCKTREEFQMELRRILKAFEDYAMTAYERATAAGRC
jgi:hypothetical protein